MSLSLENTICQECPNSIDERMEKAFPIWKTKKEWPANHPIWKEYHRIRNEYVQRCFYVVGLDGSGSCALCSKHLQQWVDRMKASKAL